MFIARLGRWTATDPAGLIDGLNLYMYCRGNPMVLMDPNGLATWKIILGQDNTGMDIEGATTAVCEYIKGLDIFDPVNDEIQIVNANNGEELKDYILNHNEAGYMAGVFYIGHSGYVNGKPVLAPGTEKGGNFGVEHVMEMNPKFRPNGFVHLLGCTNSEIARGISQYWGVLAIGNHEKTIGVSNSTNLPVSNHVLWFKDGELKRVYKYDKKSVRSRY